MAGVIILLLPTAVRACMQSLGIDAASPGVFTLYPNWKQSQVVALNLEYCLSATCPWTGTCGVSASSGNLQAITIYNYAPAPSGAVGGAAGDIGDVYFCIDCTGTCSALTPLTYAGTWLNANGNTYPAWTWNAGACPWVFNANPCDSRTGCATACFATMRVYVDVAPCPRDGAVVALGPAFNDTATFYVAGEGPGGFADETAGCQQPWAALPDPSPKVIRYLNKVADKTEAAPGDTITYTIYYGLPGAGPVANVVIFDTQPSYTHYVSGSASPPPDVGWDPDPGPPLRLQWTRPGGNGFTSGGPTAMVTFQLTVDWGNEPFDPGSGSSAAPENFRLQNFSAASYIGVGAPCNPTYVSNSADTIVHRFLYWLEADNDILFSSSLGQPPDEIIYNTFIRNVSAVKTWWNVQIWDTVPGAVLDSWCVNCGLEDPCLGWTMSPSGCAPANAGRVVNGGNTIMTWNITLGPGETINVRWKAQVKPSAAGGSTATNILAFQALGQLGLNGTGNSQVPAIFTHLAPIMLPTTYVSYTSFFGSDHGNTSSPGMFMPFFPLNKKADFSLYGLQVEGAGTWAELGGVSPPISNFIGTCTSGFTGWQANGASTYGVGSGCKVERAPAIYDPAQWHGVDATFPSHWIYKVVSNAPFLWQMRTWTLNDNQDHHFYDPTTTMTYRGFTVYTFRLKAAASGAGLGSALLVVNTDMNSALTYQNPLTTTLHMFKWDPVTLTYQHTALMDLDNESAGIICLGTNALEQGFYKIMSSQSAVIVHHGYNIYDTLGAGGCCDNFGTFAPTRETGNVVSVPGSGNFYVVGNGQGTTNSGNGASIIVGNQDPTVGSNALYKIWGYQPYGAGPAPTPIMLGGTSGKWVPLKTDTVNSGLADPGNPHPYGPPYDLTGFVAPSTALYKVELLSGGPLNVQTGTFVINVYAGGAVMHARYSSNSGAYGTQTGTDFWFHQSAKQTYNCGGGPNPPITALSNFDVFCPAVGNTARCVSSDGYDSSYTTTASDQVISFMKLSIITAGPKVRNWRITMPAGQEDLSVLYNMCMATEKGYTSPFVQQGIHYNIVAPPVVYVGQSFWITVQVLNVGNTIKTNYDGITSFTSTDPNGRIEATNMDSYNYDWIPATDQGQKVFVKVTLTQLGIQNIVATDTLDGSINGLTTIIVVGADIKLTKQPPLQVSASGDTVQFKICWSNYSTATGSSFTITDAVPDGTVYFPDTPSNHYCGATKGFGAATVAYSNTTDTPAAYATLTGPPTTAVQYLKWTIPQVGVATTGCVCFRVTVQ